MVPFKYVYVVSHAFEYGNWIRLYIYVQYGADGKAQPLYKTSIYGLWRHALAPTWVLKTGWLFSSIYLLQSPSDKTKGIIMAKLCKRCCPMDEWRVKGQILRIMGVIAICMWNALYKVSWSFEHIVQKSLLNVYCVMWINLVASGRWCVINMVRGLSSWSRRLACMFCYALIDGILDVWQFKILRMVDPRYCLINITTGVCHWYNQRLLSANAKWRWIDSTKPKCSKEFQW